MLRPALPLLVLFGLAACSSTPDDTTDPVGDTVDTTTGAELHPDHTSLVRVTWSSDAAEVSWVRYSFDDGVWLTSPALARDAGTHTATLVGIPYDTLARYEVVNEAGDVLLDGSITTGDQPNAIPNPNVLVDLVADQDPDAQYLLGSLNRERGGWTSGVYWTWIMDRRGRIVWARKTPQLPDTTYTAWSIYVQPSYDGQSLLIDEATEWVWTTREESQIVRMTLDGTVLETIPAPGLHHPFLEMADGSIFYGASRGSSETLVRIPADRSQPTEDVWTCAAFEDEFGGDGGSCESNTLNYDAASHTFLYSFYTSSSVAWIDATTFETIAAFGTLDEAWSFDPPEAQFTWQHGVHFLPNGHLLVSTQPHDFGSDVLAVREYALDDEAEVLTEVWSFGQDEGIHGTTAGEPHRLGNGNTLHNFGSGSRLREITPDKRVVWDLNWPSNRLLGKTTFLTLDDLYGMLEPAE